MSKKHLDERERDEVERKKAARVGKLLDKIDRLHKGVSRAIHQIKLIERE